MELYYSVVNTLAKITHEGEHQQSRLRALTSMVLVVCYEKILPSGNKQATNMKLIFKKTMYSIILKDITK